MKVTTTEIQNNFGKYLQLCQQEEILITKNGREIARLVPYSSDTVSEEAPVYSGKGIKLSYEKYLKLTEDSKNRYEYIDGEIFLLASPLYPHQRAVREISGAFYNWFRGKECESLTAPYDVTLHRLGKEEKICVVQPDILVICDSENIDEAGKYRGIPTLVVEVLSDSTRSKDLIKKLDLYMESGILEYWVVNNATRELYVYSFAEYKLQNIHTFKKGEDAKSLIFPGLKVNLEQVFSRM